MGRMIDLDFWRQPHTTQEMLEQLRLDEDKAVRATLAEIRGIYLSVFEEMLAGVEGNDMDAMLERVVLQGQIDRIRRQLGQPKPVDLERRRAMTRERVRRHRAKQKE